MSRRSTGYLTIRGEHAKAAEVDTITCCHCQRIVPLNKLDGTKLPPPAFCLQCMAPQCSTCAEKGECSPFLRKVEAVEASDRFARSIGIGGK